MAANLTRRWGARPPQQEPDGHSAQARARDLARRARAHLSQQGSDWVVRQRGQVLLVGTLRDCTRCLESML